MPIRRWHCRHPGFACSVTVGLARSDGLPGPIGGRGQEPNSIHWRAGARQTGWLDRAYGKGLEHGDRSKPRDLTSSTRVPLEPP